MENHPIEQPSDVILNIESLEDLSKSVEIFPDEYTYDEAVQLVKGKGLYIIGIQSSEDDSNLVEKMAREGLLPPGKYWATSGETPYSDDVNGIIVLEPDNRREGGSAYGWTKYNSDEKHKLAVYNSKPSWYSFKSFMDKPQD